jgi:hypothetical protein
MPPRISITVYDDFDLLTIHGNLDEITAHRLGGAIVEAGECRPVIIDLSRASSLSPATVRGLLRSTTTPKALVCAPGNVARLCQTTPREVGYVPVCDNLATAIALRTAAWVDRRSNH